jgi:hypothetical protein
MKRHAVAGIAALAFAFGACTDASVPTSPTPVRPGSPKAVVSIAAQLSGAIFTTNGACDGTDLNVYADKDAVYLDGGPRKAGSAGLPEGEYYVKVTEPDGTLLGTSIGASDETPVVVNSAGEFVTCYQLSAILIKASDGTPGYDDTGNSGNEYKVWISTDPAFAGSDTKTDNFKVLGANEPPPPPAALLTVLKFYDANLNGVFDEGTEQTLENWLIGITPSGFAEELWLTTYAAQRQVGDYSIREFLPIEPNWVATTPSPVAITLTSNGATVKFGNVCLGTGGGHTLGFWSNKNGQTQMNDEGSVAPELALLSALNLRTAAGADFDPTTYNAFRTWILDATAINMAYMLSAQLAAMELNVEAGFVSGASLVYAPAVNALNATVTGDFISISDLMTLANDELALHAVVLDGSPFRAYQEALKNALDDANNNLNFLQPDPTNCPYTFNLPL